MSDDTTRPYQIARAAVEVRAELEEAGDEHFRAFARSIAEFVERAERDGDSILEAVCEGIGRLEEEYWRRQERKPRRTGPFPFAVAFTHAEEFFRPGSDNWLDIAPGEGMPRDRCVRLLLSRMSPARTPLDAFRYAIDRATTVAEGLTHGKLTRALAPDLAGEMAPLNDKARDRLADALRASVRAFLDAHKLRGEAWQAAPIGSELAAKVDALAEEDGAPGVLFLDEWFARHLESIAKRSRLAGESRAGARLAKRLRAGSAERVKRAREGDTFAPWSYWFAPAEGRIGLPWLEALTRVLWADIVEPQLRHEEANPAALVHSVHEDVARIHSRSHVLEHRNGQRALVFDDRDPIVTNAIADEAVRALVERGAGLLGSMTAHRALRWEVAEGHTRALRGDGDPRVLRIEGGWSTFAHDVLDLSAKAEAERLRAIVHAQAAVVLRLPSGSTGNMLALHETPQRGRARGSIEITLGTMLLPHFVHELGLAGRHASEAKRLVPVVGLPPMVGRERDHGAQATFSMLVVRELRVRARELATEGSVAIGGERFHELARAAKLPATMLPKVLERWTADGDDAPAFLEEPATGRYVLGKAHAAERAFLAAAGATEVAASDAGRRSVAAKAAKLRRLGEGRRGRV
jgi:hypothetical protein